MAASHPTADGSAVGTIADRIRTLLSEDDTGDGPLGQCGQRPYRANGDLSALELDVRDWGMVYGMAWALTRQEDPWESVESVSRRALKSAWHVWLDYAGGEFRKPDRDQLVSTVVREFHAAKDRGQRFHPDFEDALIDLSNKCGS